jgi:spore coat polysaccharide biosynthesis protein SpsF (cytidylyltransferase family)
MLDQYTQANRLTTNTQRRTWPQGQCVEILPAKGMGRLESVARSPGSRFDHLTAYDREHVTPWYYRNCNYTNVENPLGDFSDVNMCVDTLEDFQRIKETIEKMDRPHITYGWREIAELMA